MVGSRRQRALLAAMALLLCWPCGFAAEPDVTGSRDPFGVARYPRSWIVAYQQDDDVQPREFVMSRVDRIRRDLRVEDRLRVEATLETVTYQAPDGAGVDEVMAHYRQQLDGDLLFHCEARGCGRSADWANQIFEQAILYGPDRGQRYAALEWQDTLVAVYVVERGNKRVYAHLRFLKPSGAAGLEPNSLLTRRLTRRGWSVIDGVLPAADGTIPAAGGAVLEGLAGRLSGVAGERLHLVCHLYDGADAQALLEASRRCARTAAERLMAGAAAGQDGAALQVEPFGAGPLLPRSSPPQARLELVLPGVADAAER